MRERPERTAAERRVRVRCSDWQSFLDLHTRNISRGGLFVRTDHPPEPGTAVEVELCLPDGRSLLFMGEVAHAVSTAEAEQRSTPAGMGIRLVHMSAEDLLELENILRDLHGASESQEPPPPPVQAPSGDADLEDPDLLDALQNYVGILRGKDPMQAIGLTPEADIGEIDARLETLAERFAPDWYAERSPEVRAAAAEVALALRDIHLRLRSGLGVQDSGDEEGEGLSAGRLFGDLEFLERSRLSEDAGSPVAVSDRTSTEWIRTGMAFLRAHRYREAHESLRQALVANPADNACRRDFHLALGHDLREAGRFEEALESLSEALKLDPNCVEADAAMRGIRDSQKRAGKKSAIFGRLLGK